MNKIIDQIFDIAINYEKKTLIEMALKGSEEMGELAEAVLSYQKCPGCEHKNLGIKEVTEEACDIIILTLALLSKAGVDKKVMKNVLNDKLNKWFDKNKDENNDR